MTRHPPIILQPASDVPVAIVRMLEKRIDEAVNGWADDYGYSLIETPSVYNATSSMVKELRHIRVLALGRIHGGAMGVDRETWYHVEAAASRAIGEAGVDA